MTQHTVLVVDDERNIRRSLEIILDGEGYHVVCASSGEEALKVLEQEEVHGVLLDIVMPGMNGIDALQKMRKARPGLAVIVISGHGTVQDAVRATQLGAYDFLEKPLSREKVLLAVSHALETSVLVEENRDLREKIESRFEMVGDSQAIQAVHGQIEKVARTTSRVLIQGESGTGKELIAREIHRQSLRHRGQFVKVNCAAIPEELIESELFGHEKGAFTSASDSRRGRFEAADGGTLFLDEIGDMSLGVQSKVLHALEYGEFERVGGSKTLQVDVRLLAATNKDLQKRVEDRRFREDLFFRLNVVPIIAPPLRDRRDDIPHLVDHFLKRYAQENDLRPKQITKEALEALCSYDWPGNIRELQNLVERLSIMIGDETIGLSDLPRLAGPNISRPAEDSDHSPFTGLPAGGTLREVREAVEKVCIADALEKSSWNVTQAARVLGIERTNLHKKIKQYELER